jgi:hypothetical protein
MEVTQRIQPIQDEAYQLFTEIEGRGKKMEKFITTAKQCLEEPINESIIQDFTEHEAMERQQVEAY